MKRLFLYIGLLISTGLHADVMQLTCSSDKVFSLNRVGNTYESHEMDNKLIIFVSIDLVKSKIKISWRNDTKNTTGDINMKIIDVSNDEKIILGSRAESGTGYELLQFDLINLQTSWTMIEPTINMHMLSKCFKSN